MMRSFHKLRVFRKRHGWDFPMIPRRLGLAMKLERDGGCACGKIHYGENFYKWPSRVFWPLFSDKAR